MASKTAIRLPDHPHEIERYGHVNGISREVDRAVVSHPLHWLTGAKRPEPRLDTLDHQVANRLTRDACSGGIPGNRFAIMAIEHKSDAYHFPFPTGELHPIGAPAHVRARDCDATFMLARPPMACMALEEEAVLLHKPVDPLGIDGFAARGAACSPVQSGNSAITVTGYLIDQSSDFGREGFITFPVLRSACPTAPGQAFEDV